MELDELEPVDLDLLLHAEGMESELWREGADPTLDCCLRARRSLGRQPPQICFHSEGNDETLRKSPHPNFQPHTAFHCEGGTAAESI